MQQSINLQPAWSKGSLIAFRFFFVYFIFYVAPFPLGWIPYGGMLWQPFHSLSLKTTEALGTALLGTAYSLPPSATGSGDTIHNYVQLLLFSLLSVGVAVVWSLLDRRRDNYEKLLYWLMILLRYYLAVIMMSYGFSKIFKTQFPFPSFDQLNKSYGESSPMNLLWTFMGYSTAYNVFTGLGETVGGFLLFFRRTRLLGAMILATVMSHVVMLNFAYDVPVKLFSLHLLAMALFIMVPDATRLINLFVLNRPSEPKPERPVYYSAKTKWAYFGGKTLILLYLTLAQIPSHLKTKHEIDEFAARAHRDQPLDGQYEVETFVMNNDTIPAVVTDTRRWKGMMINGKKIEVQSMDGVSTGWHFLGNVHYRKIVMLSPDLSTTGNFTFNADSTTLMMKGILNQDSLQIMSKRKSGSSMLLVDRGFHWVNEYPYNR